MSKRGQPRKCVPLGGATDFVIDEVSQAIDSVAKGGREGEEHALDGLINAGRVGRGNGMESRGSSWTTIATVTGATGAIALDEVSPVGTEYDGAFRFDDRLTIHTNSMELV